MSYIAYLDLLGTKELCEDEELYYKQIKKFSNTIEELSPIVGDSGRIGIFSDCVYLECAEIEKTLQFLTVLRTMLIGDDLFFNAALSAGELGVEDMNSTQKDNIFGVRFTNKEIAGIYCKQTNFRGVGIWIDPEIVDTVKKTNYQVVESIYYKKEEKKEKVIFEPTRYYDISLFETNTPLDDFDSERKKSILSIIIKALFSAHCKSRNYSVYYISLLINIIRSCNVNSIKWNRKTNLFENSDSVFRVIYSFLKECDRHLSNIIGLDSMVLALLNQLYLANNIKAFDKDGITDFFMKEFNCLNTQYRYSLDLVPKEPFSGENRRMFINFCNSNMAGKFVDSIFLTDVD